MTAVRELATPVIKICGVTRQEDLVMLAREGVNMVGLNFVPTSPRCLHFDQGQRLAEQAHKLGIAVVSVVRNAAASDLAQLLRSVKVDFLQLHGDELPGMLAAVADEVSGPLPPIIRALSWSGRKEEEHLATAWQQFAAHHPGQLAAWLVDAYAPAAGGGTGRLADWSQLTPRPMLLAGCPLILAGGLGPHNVADAIRSVRPAGVDTASGVEVSPGIKDADRVAGFARQAREAFSERG